MKNEYAQLLDRIKAAVIDSILLITVMYLTSEILNSFENVPDYVRISLAVFFFILYDPIFTSFFGGTVGHTISGITVQKDTEVNGNINFLFALLRFILKLTLGWVSLVTVTGNKKKKAIHDLAVNSVVLKR